MIVILLCWLFPGDMAYAGTMNEASIFSWQDTMDNLDLQEIEDYKKTIDSEINPELNKKTLKEWLIDFVQGDWDFDFKSILSSIGNLFCQEIISNSSLMGKLIILSVISALLVNLQTSFASSIAKFSQLTCFMALSAIALGSFKVTLNIGQQAIESMAGFMTAMLPQMMVLVAGLGNINSSVMLFPVLMTTAATFANAVKNIVLPFIILSAVLGLINQISESIKVEKMAKFFGQIAQISLGFFITVFVGLITLKTVYASVLDKVVLRTGKFISDNAIPVVGKILSDTIEVTAGYVMILKNAIGVYGVLMILGLIAAPIIKIVVISLIYRVVAAAVEPMGDARTATVLDIMSHHLWLIIASIASVSIMFIIMIALIAGLTNNWTLPG